MVERTTRKNKVAKVLKVSTDKSVIVGYELSFAHPVYKKIIKKNRKLMVHDEKNQCGVGDTVKIMETRPISKSKKWRVVEIIQKAK